MCGVHCGLDWGGNCQERRKGGVWGGGLRGRKEKGSTAGGCQSCFKLLNLIVWLYVAKLS